MTPVEFVGAHHIILLPAIAVTVVFTVAGAIERLRDRRQR